MKRRMFLAAMAAVLLASPTMAQYYSRRPQQSSRHSYSSRWDRYNSDTYYGLRLGWVGATVSSDDPRLNGSSSMSGLNIGAVVGFGLTPTTPIYLETGLFYTEKGGKGVYDNIKFTYDLNYLELPIVVKYKYDCGDGIALQPFFGGFLAYGVGGKMKDYNHRQAFSSFSSDYFEHFDGGIRLGCGFSYESLYVDLTYDIGLANICHDTFDKSHTGCLYLNIGVDF